MREQNYTVQKMFLTGDNFYAGLGLLRVPQSFWELSMLEKPTDGRDVICHATAWDFYDASDFRIRMCTRDFVYEDLTTIFHEMGHTQYQQQYKHQPQADISRLRGFIVMLQALLYHKEPAQGTHLVP